MLPAMPEPCSKFALLLLASLACPSVDALHAEMRATSFPWLAFEGGPVRPIARSPSGRLVFALNVSDQRLQVFRASGGTLVPAGEVRVGIEPVAVNARSEDEVFVVNHISDSVSVVDVCDPDRPFVRETLLVGDEPRDLVFAGRARRRVYVSAARRGQHRPGSSRSTSEGVGRADIWVFDAEDLSSEPDLLTLFCDTPRALAVSPDGQRVFAAAFRSGNGTTVLSPRAVDPLFFFEIGDGFVAPGLPPPLESADGVAGPSTGDRAAK